MSQEVYIMSAARTPLGSFQGAFTGLTAPELGAIAIRGALTQAQMDADRVEQCIMGQVLTAGAGQAPARQAALKAGLPNTVPCMTINKVCGSGLKAVMLAADAIQLGHSQVIVAGGQENMTLAPHLLTKSRQGYRMGHFAVADSMVLDGLWDPYHDFHMGSAAELCVKEYQFTRQEQDEYAAESYRRAETAQKRGYYASEIVPVTIEERGNSQTVASDEEPARVKYEKMPTLRPAFAKDGTITAANASKINDGAAALVLMASGEAKKHNQAPLARFIAQATCAQDPKWFTTAPAKAMTDALAKAKLNPEQIDLWEINEAFAVVTLAAMKELKIPHNKVNIHGGAIALGHPIGASGARILTTLVHALKTHQKRYGVASLCIGGGEAVAVVVENLA